MVEVFKAQGTGQVLRCRFEASGRSVKALGRNVGPGFSGSRLCVFTTV